MASVSNLYIDQGSDFSFTVDMTNSDGTAMDLSGYTATAHIRKAYTSTSTAAVFSTSVSEVSGQITLLLTGTQTSALDFGRYVYDCVIISSSGDKTRVLEGQVIVTPGVTR